MSTSQQRGECVSFRRRADLPGVELRTVKNTGSSWFRYSGDYEFFAPASFEGSIWHRRRETEIAAGDLVCVQPGEVLGVTRVRAAGTAHSVNLDAVLLQRLLAAHARSLAGLRLRAVSHMSADVHARLDAVVLALCSDAPLAHLERSLGEFAASLAGELIDNSQPLSRKSFEANVAERIRNYLPEDASDTVDLETLARGTGLSRFQVVRIFKRRYGLPPHCYQLQRRLGLAQKRLREGARPAQVAIELGFVDQSHLTRHFKRLFGVTPAQYGRAARSPFAEVLPFSASRSEAPEHRELMLQVANAGSFSSV